MIEWNKVTKESTLSALAIAKRAESLGLTGNPSGVLTDLMMDLEAVNLSEPMDFDRLLAADDLNFAHDVNGIRRHLNRETGELENCFVPRFAESNNQGG